MNFRSTFAKSTLAGVAGVMALSAAASVPTFAAAQSAGYYGNGGYYDPCQRDTTNRSTVGALVGGVIYNPDTPVWYLVFAFAVWTAANVSLRYLMRFHRIRRAIKGDSVMLVRDRRLVMREFRRNGLEMEQFRTMLRENGIFSMFDVDDVRFETNGRITISRRNEPPESYLLVNGGKVMEDALERSGKGKRWLLRHLRQAGYPDAEKLFCVEWTPGRGFYIVPLEEPDGRDAAKETLSAD